MGLAVALVIGFYLGSLVQTLVKDLFMPLIGLAFPGLTNLATYIVAFKKQQSVSAISWLL